MAEKHSVSIDGKLYSELKEYCDLNGLKLNIYAEELIRKQFSIEKFGATPFDRMDKPQVREPEKKVIDELYDKSINEKVEPVIGSEPEVIGPEKKEDEPINEPIHEPISEPKPKRKVTRLN